MTPMQVFILTSVVFWLVVAAVAFGFFKVLQRGGFFQRAKDDAAKTLSDAAKDAADKIGK